MPDQVQSAATQTTTTEAVSGPNGILDYVSFNMTSDGLLGQVGQLGSDLVGAAKNFVGISDDSPPSATQSHDYLGASETFQTANPEGIMDLRNMPQVFREINVGGPGQKVGKKSCSYLMSNNDFLYCDILDMNAKEDFMSKPEIQKLVINEFQPYDNIFLGQAIEGVVGGLSKIVGGFFAAIGNLGGRALLKNYLIDNIAKNPADFYANSAVYDSYGNYIAGEAEAAGAGLAAFTLFQTDPMLRILRMFSNGHWLNTYELPFYGNNYLDENRGGKWTQEGSKKQWSDGISTALEGFGIYYPTTPTWSLDIAGATRPELSTEFYLINKDEEWMLRNFKFMHALFSGTQFVMMKQCVVQSPNVYNVHVDGRFEIIWAAMTMSATFEGKLRKCSYMNTMLNTFYDENSSSRRSLVANPVTKTVTNKDTNKEETVTEYASTNNYTAVSTTLPQNQRYRGLRSITDNTLWPDAWKINLKIQDLGVNCFNNYLNYQMFGASGARLRANTSSSSINKITADAINKALNYAASLISDPAKRAKAQDFIRSEKTQSTIQNIENSSTNMNAKEFTNRNVNG